MTAGDPISVHQSLPNGGYLEIRPPVGVIWMVKNIYFGGKWELYRSSFNGEIMLSTGISNGFLINHTMIATNQIFFKIKNISGRSINCGFDGLVIQ
jgi:hypothetical protein